MLVHLKPNQAPRVAYERAYWKEHKIVPQKRTIMKEVDGVLLKAGSRALKSAISLVCLAQGCVLHFLPRAKVPQRMAGARSFVAPVRSPSTTFAVGFIIPTF